MSLSGSRRLESSRDGLLPDGAAQEPALYLWGERINLVGKDRQRLHPYMRSLPRRGRNFTFRSWEELYAELIRGDPALSVLGGYVERKSAHYRRAFSLP